MPRLVLFTKDPKRRGCMLITPCGSNRQNERLFPKVLASAKLARSHDDQRIGEYSAAIFKRMERRNRENLVDNHLNNTLFCIFRLSLHRILV